MQIAAVESPTKLLLQLPAVEDRVPVITMEKQLLVHRASSGT